MLQFMATCFIQCTRRDEPARGTQMGLLMEVMGDDRLPMTTAVA